MSDETEIIGLDDKTQVRTKVYHLPSGGRIHELQDMRERRAAKRQEIKDARLQRAWINVLIAFNVIAWTITTLYYAWKWEDIFR